MQGYNPDPNRARLVRIEQPPNVLFVAIRGRHFASRTVLKPTGKNDPTIRTALDELQAEIGAEFEQGVREIHAVPHGRVGNNTMSRDFNISVAR